MGIIDTHCHLDLIEGRGENIDTILANASTTGVEALVQIATDLDSSLKNQKLYAQASNNSSIPQIYWTAGLHPGSMEFFDSIDDIFSIVRENYQRPSFLGIGETGLDYFHTSEEEDIEKQKESFRKHLDLAEELNLPVVLHTRDDRSYNPEKTTAISDALEMVKSTKVIGVLHCFTYTQREALPFVDLGWFVSYSGALTFSNAKAIQEGAAHIPLANLLVETDAPFLAPVPHRGKINQPAFVQYTLDFLSELRERECKEEQSLVKETIAANSRRFINLKNEMNSVL